MKSIAMNGLTALEEIEIRLVVLVDESTPNYAVRLLKIIEDLNKIKLSLREFDKISEEKCPGEEEFRKMCSEKQIEFSTQYFQLFQDQFLEKNKYIQELEGYLSGDPNLVADKATRDFWRHSAILYSDKLEKKIKELEDQLKFR